MGILNRALQILTRLDRNRGNLYSTAGFLSVEGRQCYNSCGYSAPHEVADIDRFMVNAPPARYPRFSPSAPPDGHRIRWLLRNSSTKVLFRHLAEVSTVIPYAAAPASLLSNHRLLAVPTRSESKR
jgi:hypothetical protein